MKLPCSVLSEHGKSSAIILDLSVGGAFLGTDDAPPLEETVTLSFKGQGRGKIIAFSLKAIVIHSGRYLQGFDNFNGFGVRFKNIPPRVAAELREILAEGKISATSKFVIIT
jgi:hypothetical protein